MSEMSQSESDFSLWKCPISSFSSITLIEYAAQDAWIQILALLFTSYMTLNILTFLSFSFHVNFVELIIVPFSWVWIIRHNKGDVLNLDTAICWRENVLFIHLVPYPIYQPRWKSLYCKQVEYYVLQIEIWAGPWSRPCWQLVVYYVRIIIKHKI